MCLHAGFAFRVGSRRWNGSGSANGGVQRAALAVFCHASGDDQGLLRRRFLGSGYERRETREQLVEFPRADPGIVTQIHIHDRPRDGEAGPNLRPRRNAGRAENQRFLISYGLSPTVRRVALLERVDLAVIEVVVQPEIVADAMRHLMVTVAARPAIVGSDDPCGCQSPCDAEVFFRPFIVMLFTVHVYDELIGFGLLSNRKDAHQLPGLQVLPKSFEGQTVGGLGRINRPGIVDRDPRKMNTGNLRLCRKPRFDTRWAGLVRAFVRVDRLPLQTDRRYPDKIIGPPV